MTELRPVSATEFARNFARHQDQALAGATHKVTGPGRVVGGYISARDSTLSNV